MTLDLLSKGGDREPWRIYAMTVTMKDLVLYFDIYEAMGEYEICQVLQHEMLTRVASEGEN